MAPASETVAALPRRARSKRGAIKGFSQLWLGSVIVAVVLFVALAGPLMTSRGPLEQNLAMRNRPPSAEYWFGTDRYGRDVFARVVYGAKISMTVGGVVTLVSLAGGMVIGAITGYYRGKVDQVLMRVIDVFMSFPAILVAIAVMAVLGQGVANLIFALTVIHVPRLARTVRGAVVQVREREFVEAIRALGASDVRIIVRHVAPNALAPVLVQASLTFVDAIRTEATLSFLGLGTPPPLPSWGNMLDDARALLHFAPWTMFFPAAAIAITILGLNLLGDGLRDKLDPTLREG